MWTLSMDTPSAIYSGTRIRQIVQFIIVACRINHTYAVRYALTGRVHGSGVTSRVSNGGSRTQFLPGRGKALSHPAGCEHFGAKARGVGGAAPVRSRLRSAKPDRCRRLVTRVCRANAESQGGNPQRNQGVARA